MSEIQLYSKHWLKIKRFRDQKKKLVNLKIKPAFFCINWSFAESKTADKLQHPHSLEMHCYIFSI